MYKTFLNPLKSDAFPQTLFIYTRFFCCPQTLPYSTNQKLSICTSLSVLFSKACLFVAKSFSFVQAFPYRHPKPLFFALHFPFAPSHNLLSTKERRCSFYLRPKSSRCNAGTSHRFKAFSPPFCAKNRLRLVSPEVSPKVFPAEL